MLNDIDRKSVAVEATTNLTPEYVTGNSQTLNDPAGAFVAQMHSLPTTTLTCTGALPVQKSHRSGYGQSLQDFTQNIQCISISLQHHKVFIVLYCQVDIKFMYCTAVILVKTCNQPVQKLCSTMCKLTG